MLKESDALLADIQKVQYGLKHELRLGAALYTLDIPERIQLLEGFIAHYPDIPLAIDNSLQSALLRNLWQGKLDLAMIIGMPVPETDFEQRLSLRQDVELLFPDHLPRLTLRREPVRLLVPIESPLAALEQVPTRAMHGQRIATLAPGHGDLLVNAIERTLRDAGAEPVYPPESNAIAVERFGRQFRIPAVSLGWFTSGKSNRDNVVERPIEGLSLHTELVLLGNSQQLSHSAARFWSFANGVLPKTI
jgi:DNA-binding transcriptional LysR family regulator